MPLRDWSPSNYGFESAELGLSKIGQLERNIADAIGKEALLWIKAARMAAAVTSSVPEFFRQSTNCQDIEDTS